MLLLKFLMKLEEYHRKRAYKYQMKRIKYGQVMLTKLHVALIKCREEEDKIKEKMDEVKMYM